MVTQEEHNFVMALYNLAKGLEKKKKNESRRNY